MIVIKIGKHIGLLLIPIMFIVGCGDGDGGSNSTAPSTSSLPTSVNNDGMQLSFNGNDVILRWKIYCYAEAGQTFYDTEGKTAYLHYHLWEWPLNRDEGHDCCNDILATAVIINGWAEFRFENLAFRYREEHSAWPEYSIWRVRWWASLDEAYPEPEVAKWACVPEAYENPYYREDCDGGPGVEAILSLDQISLVPPETPCDRPIPCE